MNVAVPRPTPWTGLVAWLLITLRPGRCGRGAEPIGLLGAAAAKRWRRVRPLATIPLSRIRGREPSGTGSVQVDAGAQIAARADLPVAGPLRLRIEAATARWDVRQTTYDPEAFTETANTSAGHMSARHLVALAGVRVGRAPACAHVSAGGGLYALGFRGASVRRPGASLAMGIEIPTGAHGAIQLDGMLHLIATRDRHPIASSTALALNLLAGWAYRF